MYGVRSYIFPKFVLSTEEANMMKSIYLSTATILAIFCLSMVSVQSLNAQYVTPAILDTASLESQLTYIQERTRIYNDFRAIREDIFLKMKRT